MPPVGFEPTIPALRVRCLTTWPKRLMKVNILLEYRVLSNTVVISLQNNKDCLTTTYTLHPILITKSLPRTPIDTVLEVFFPCYTSTTVQW